MDIKELNDAFNNLIKVDADKLKKEIDDAKAEKVKFADGHKKYWKEIRLKESLNEGFKNFQYEVDKEGMLHLYANDFNLSLADISDCADMEGKDLDKLADEVLEEKGLIKGEYFTAKTDAEAEKNICENLNEELKHSDKIEKLKRNGFNVNRLSDSSIEISKKYKSGQEIYDELKKIGLKGNKINPSNVILENYTAVEKPADYKERYELGCKLLAKAASVDPEYYEIVEDNYKYPFGLTLIEYDDKEHEYEIGSTTIDLYGFKIDDVRKEVNESVNENKSGDKKVNFLNDLHPYEYFEYNTTLNLYIKSPKFADAEGETRYIAVEYDKVMKRFSYYICYSADNVQPLMDSDLAEKVTKADLINLQGAIYDSLEELGKDEAGNTLKEDHDFNEDEFYDRVDATFDISLYEYGVVRNPKNDMTLLGTKPVDGAYTDYEVTYISLDDVRDVLSGMEEGFFDYIDEDKEECLKNLDNENLAQYIMSIDGYNGYWNAAFNLREDKQDALNRLQQEYDKETEGLPNGSKEMYLANKKFNRLKKKVDKHLTEELGNLLTKEELIAKVKEGILPDEYVPSDIGQGMGYKINLRWEEVPTDDIVIYIPEYGYGMWDEPNNGMPKEDSIYTKADFREITKELGKRAEEEAEYLFQAVDWQYPESLWNEMEFDDEAFDEAFSPVKKMLTKFSGIREDYDKSTFTYCINTGDIKLLDKMIDEKIAEYDALEKAPSKERDEVAKSVEDMLNRLCVASVSIIKEEDFNRLYDKLNALHEKIIDDNTAMWNKAEEEQKERLAKFQKMLKNKSVNEKEKRDVLQIKFIGVDEWNRPAFKPVNKEKKYFLTDVNNLFNEDATEEEIKKFYADKKPLRDYITYHGYSLDDDPMGSKIKFDLEIV